MNVVETVRDAYRGHWGEPSRQTVFRTAEYEMEVLNWGIAATDEGVELYATVGASRWDMPGAEQGHRAEYFVGLRPGRDEIASRLAALGLYARREGVNVDHGHTVPADFPLWPGTDMRTLLVVRQRQSDGGLPALTAPGGVHVEFLQVIPIFESERRYKSEYGVEALLQRWERLVVPFWDPHRKPEAAA